MSSDGAPFEASPTGALPLQRWGHSRLDATPTVTYAGAAAARSLLGCNASSPSSSAYLTAIATDGALPKLHDLGLYTTAAMPETARENYGAESAVEYAYAVTNLQSRSVGKELEIIPNTFKQTMTLPAKLDWKVDSDK